MGSAATRKTKWPSRRFQSPKVGESNVQSSVVSYLNIERIKCEVVTCGLARFGPCPNHRWVTLAKDGHPDIQAYVPVGRKVRDPLTGETLKVGPMAWVAYIETKAKRGKLSKDQIAFREQCQRDGALYILARSIDDVRDVILPRIQQGLFTAPAHPPT